ncbi:condensin-2 complex subunit D3-like isoform X2 [Leptidea sinapis]|uniref:condensin-2 complex subunit D3-like isoform X2 n=1 Tax=Leptidea sinapis TaxID=189913 RepID=UPI00212148F2|nr:condensin-2 complex subunit D3-like isoform X2 [Leptidea sinapis]
MQVFEEIEKLHLDSLNDEWVQSVYDSEFMEFGDLPPEYESAIESNEDDVRIIFENIVNLIEDLVNRDSDTLTRISTEIKHQRLSALIGFYINDGNKNILISDSRNNALWASRLYYKLLVIPGQTYHVYHSQLFTHSLSCLKFPKAVCDLEGTCFMGMRLLNEVNLIIKNLSGFVNDLRNVVQKLDLNPGEVNFEEILQNLVDITGGAILYKFNVDKVALANVTRVIYEVIDMLLCSSNGQPNPMAIKLLFKCLLQKLVAASLDYRQANNIVRASFVTYTGLILKKYAQIALPSFLTLLQHLAYRLDGSEKAEVRMTRVNLTVGLMSLLPQRSFRSYVRWMIRLNSSTKVPHRQIALEVLFKLLPYDPEETNESGAETPRKISTDTIGSEERSSQNGDATDSGLDSSNKTSVNLTDSEGESPDIVPELIIDNEDFEEDVPNILQHRRHCVPHMQIVRAIYDRVNDVSSTLRTRALAIIIELLDTPLPAVQKAIIELNGMNGGECSIASVASRCAVDERAVVRKAAVTVFHQLLLRIPHPSYCTTLVSLCRDASILVRTAAISALSDVAMQKPSEVTITAFLAGPMHQLSDPETKIQAQVTACVQSLLISPLTKYKEGVPEDPRSGLFLAGIVQLRMGKHLQKACKLLQESSNCINHRLVDIVSTHLGVSDERDMRALVLLSAVGRLVDQAEVTFLVDYYYSLVNDDKKRDSRLLPLTLEMISVWERHIREPERRLLWQHLIDRITSSLDSECRTAYVTCAAILYPLDLQWANDLMKLSGRRALAGAGLREWLRAADVSLAAPARPSPDLLGLFLAAIENPPSEWSGGQLAACVVGAGRLCLRSRAAAKRAAPPLARLLGSPPARDTLPARLNALLALTDICTRYSCIVDPLLESICGCLEKDAPRQLRRAASRALTRLLLGDFLRLRTPLYYRYCALLADDDRGVREPVEYYITTGLAVDVINHHFVDSVIYFNKEETERPDKQGEADIEELQERVTVNMVSHAMKKTVAEELVPAVMRLHAALRARGEQPADYMLRLATDLYNDYRHEIEELIENDEDLMERVRQFQETHGLEPITVNARNLVTSNVPPDPETPRAPRKRVNRSDQNKSPRKRILRV